VNLLLADEATVNRRATRNRTDNEKKEKTASWKKQLFALKGEIKSNHMVLMVKHGTKTQSPERAQQKDKREKKGVPSGGRLPFYKSKTKVRREGGNSNHQGA